MFREIRRSEKITDVSVDKKSEEYRNIEPETDMTVEEAENFWNELFNKMGEA